MISTGAQTLEQFFFDDFAYASLSELEAHGWVMRTRPGWPGVPGAIWGRENVCLVDDPALPENRLLRLRASIGPAVAQGAQAQTVRQAQVCHRRKYLGGTYAARVRFSDEPAAGPGGDQVVQSFYAITPYRKPLDPAYSEMDFEYLPGGGWGLPPGTLVTTTWDTVQIEPWHPVNASDSLSEALGGWRVLVIQVDVDGVRYFLDGRLLATHREPYYPDSPMSLNFNLWFIDGGLITPAGQASAPQSSRTYLQDIDWVYQAKDRVLSSGQVLEQVQSLRSTGTAFTDTVPEHDPPLDCPCDL